MPSLLCVVPSGLALGRPQQVAAGAMIEKTVPSFETFMEKDGK